MIDCCHKHGTEFVARLGCPACLEDRLRHTRILVKRECASIAGVHRNDAGPFKDGVGYRSVALPEDVSITSIPPSLRPLA